MVFRPVRDRLLNVTLRPNPASWVIPVGVPPPPAMTGRVLLPRDLLVGVAEGRLCLLDRQGRSVTPVATHMLAHSRAPELARFLLDIPRDGRPVLTGFWWGQAAGLPVLPRVQRGRIVLSPARWLCDCTHVQTEKDFDEWRARWHPPASCYISESDNRLLVDLDDPGDRKHLLDSFVRLAVLAASGRGTARARPRVAARPRRAAPDGTRRPAARLYRGHPAPRDGQQSDGRQAVPALDPAGPGGDHAPARKRMAVRQGLPAAGRDGRGSWPMR